MSGLIPYLVNGGVAGVIVVAFMLGLIYPKRVVDEKNQQIKELANALALERQRGDAAVAAAAITRDILVGLRGGTGNVQVVAQAERQTYTGGGGTGGTPAIGGGTA